MIQLTRHRILAAFSTYSLIYMCVNWSPSHRFLSNTDCKPVRECPEGEEAYFQAHPDVERIWKPRSAYSHWMRFGKSEGRHYICRCAESDHVKTNSRLDTSFQIVVPIEPDREVIKVELQKKQEDEIPWGNCESTSQIQMNFKQLHEQEGSSLVIQSLNKDGLVKIEGGDEYYIEYFSTGSNSADAIGYVKDLGDGSYKVDFMQPLLRKKNGTDQADNILPGGKITVILQYTCGIGKLMPPSKKKWSTSGAINRKWEASLPEHFHLHVVSAEKRVKPMQFPELASFDYVYSVGDSLMSQFVGGLYFTPNYRRRRKFYHGVAISNNAGEILNYRGMDLDSSTIYEWVDILKSLIEVRNLGNKNGTKCALIMGSAVWDILVCFAQKYFENN